MSNSRLVINNQKIKLIENRNSLQIKKGKLILSEDVTDVSTEQAFSVISDTGKSLVNIGEGILKMYVSQMKLGLNLLLLPLTRNLNEIIKSYEQDIGEVNKLFSESIPSNVQKTSQLINISANPSTFVFSKIFDNLQKVEGVSQVINAKNITDIVVPPPLQNVINNFYEKGKDIPSGMWQTFTKDLPEYFKIEGSSYSTLDKESTKLKELNDEINAMFGTRRESAKGISDLKIEANDRHEKFAIEFVNAFRTNNNTSLINTFSFDFQKNKSVIDNILHVVTQCDKNSSSTYNLGGSTAPAWVTSVAAGNPPPTNEIVRFSIACSLNSFHITIKKNQSSAPYQASKCYFSFDDDNVQTTPDYDISSFF